MEALSDMRSFCLKIWGRPAARQHNAGASDGEAFYLGCVMDGRIRGYACAAARFRIAGVCAVGLEGKRADTVLELRRNTGIVDSRIRIFYARGAFDRDKLNPVHRLMLRGAMESMEGSAKYAAILELMQKGCDFVSEENIRPAAEWIIWRTGKNNAVFSRTWQGRLRRQYRRY